MYGLPHAVVRRSGGEVRCGSRGRDCSRGLGGRRGGNLKDPLQQDIINASDDVVTVLRLIASPVQPEGYVREKFIQNHEWISIKT